MFLLVFLLVSCFLLCPADRSCLALLQFFERQTIEDANLVFEDDLPEFTQDELLATPTDEPEVGAGEGGAQPEAGPGAGPDAPRDRGRHYPLPPHFVSIQEWSDDDEVTPAGAPDADEPGIHVVAPARPSADQRGKAPVDGGSSRQPPASAP